MTSPASPRDGKSITLARIGRDQLPVLASVRDRPDVRVHQDGTIAWVTWPPGREDIILCLQPVHGVEFFTLRDGLWFRFGSRVPAAIDPPRGEGGPVAGVVTPARLNPLPPVPNSEVRLPIRLIPGREAHRTSGLTCALAELSRWADTATTAGLAKVRAACTGTRIVLLGQALPAVAGSTRFWGDRILIPLGLRLEPNIPASTLRSMLDAGPDDVVVIGEDDIDVIPGDRFEPVTRAGIRLAIREFEGRTVR